MKKEKYYIALEKDKIQNIRNILCLLYCIVSDKNMILNIIETYNLFNQVNRKTE